MSRALDRLADAAVLAAAAGATALVAEAWVSGLSRARAARRIDPSPPPAPARWPSVTVVVPAWAERGTIEPTLEALGRVDYPDWDVVVVAGGPDGTLEAARAAVPVAALPRARVIEQGHDGKPAALNLGVAAASGEVVAIVDADTRVEPGWLRALVAPLAADGADGPVAATGEFRPARSTPVSRAESMARVDVYEIRREPILQGSGTIAVRRDALATVGGFARDAFADDWELDAALAARGLERAYAPAARVVTERPATIREWWRNEVRWRRAHLRAIAREPGHHLGGPAAAARTLLPYLLGWAAAGAAVLAGAVAFAGPPRRDLQARAVALPAIVLAAAALRPAALVAEVVVATGDRRWLRDAWVPSLLGLLALPASVLATLTSRRATLAFKGPRPAAR